MKKLQHIVSVAVLLFVGGIACAHELWLEKQEDKLVLLYGHTGITHDNRQYVEYSLDRIVQVECYDERAERIDVEYEQTYPIAIEAQCAVTYVLTSSGYWTKTPFGTKNLSKGEAKSPLHSTIHWSFPRGRRFVCSSPEGASHSVVSPLRTTGKRGE